MTRTTAARADKKSQIIAAIDKPLGFYVLALLIVETFLGFVSAGSRDDAIVRLGFYLGVGMFVYITLIVTLIVWNKAHVLTFDKAAHMADRKNQGTFGTSAKPIADGDRLSAPVPATLDSPAPPAKDSP